MSIYFKSKEMENSFKALVNLYVQECKRNGEIPESFAELIKHNFLAKYVFYNKTEKSIEIGINESKFRSRTYPQIKEYSYPVDEAKAWLFDSFKDGKGDLEFYGSLINNNSRFTPNKHVVVI